MLQGVVHRQHVHLQHEADVYHAALVAYSLVQQAGASTLLATEAATLVSELGMNIVKYAGHGQLMLSLQPGAQGYLEVMAKDRGPGIADLQLAMQDNFSTRGTLGVGLPGVRRMADDFDIQSVVGNGTTVRARRNFGVATQAPVFAPAALVPAARPAPEPPRPADESAWQQGLACRPCYGEAVSGDGCVALELPHGLLVGVIDVLGHGVDAHELARACERWLKLHASPDVLGLMQELHRAIKGSLGAAATLAWLDAQAGSATVVGVGNTRLYTLQEPCVRLDAQPGIVGSGQLPRLRPAVLRVAPCDVLMLATDGISERLSARDVMHLRLQPARQIAQQVLREHGKDHDDATCLVLRWPH